VIGIESVEKIDFGASSISQSPTIRKKRDGLKGIRGSPDQSIIVGNKRNEIRIVAESNSQF